MSAPQILVIDDSATMRKLVEIAFRGSHCVVEFAGTGAEGLARATAEPPDVILLDFMLPDMKGIDVCKRLADHAHTARVGVVVMSGKPEVASLFRDVANVVAFLPKPFTAASVHSQLTAALRQGEHAALRSNTSRIQTLPAPAPIEAGPIGGNLELRGNLAIVAPYDALRLAIASGTTGVLVLERHDISPTQPCTSIFVRAGTTVMCTTTASTSEFDQLVVPFDPSTTSALEAARAQRECGKPVVVSFAEAGFATNVDLVAALKAQSYRLLAAALARRDGRFHWREQALPSYVASFGRPISIISAGLEHARTGTVTIAELDHVYQRTPRFSESIGGVKLSTLERAVLAAVDGITPLRDLVDRIRQPARQLSTTIGRLAAVDLVVRVDATQRECTTPPIVVYDLDAEFVAQLRTLVARRPLALEVLVVSELSGLDAVVSRARPQTILIGSDTRALPSELYALARLTAATVVAVLEVGDAKTAADALALGYDAVLFKPVHIAELERLLTL